MFLPLSAHYVYCIYRKCSTDGPTDVWCVCACACNNAEQANIMRRRSRGHLSLEVCERTGHGPSFTFVKWINSFYFIKGFWPCAFSFFFFFSATRIWKKNKKHASLFLRTNGRTKNHAKTLKTQPQKPDLEVNVSYMIWLKI